MSNKRDHITNIARAFNKASYHHVTAIIVAAGSGSRMGSEVTKQFLQLDGKPLIINTLLAFEKCAYIDDIVLVAREDEMELYPHLIKTHGISKVIKLVSGGETRQESVLNGLDVIPDNADFIAIHDGARPLVTPDQIKNVILAAYGYKAASAAMKCKDTPKAVTRNGYIEKGLDRDSVMLMQTPQVFNANLYRAAAYTAKVKDFKGSDDCAIAEFAGFPVMTVDCGYENIKVTTPEDLLFAEIIIQKRRAADG